MSIGRRVRPKSVSTALHMYPVAHARAQDLDFPPKYLKLQPSHGLCTKSQGQYIGGDSGLSMNSVR